MPEDLGQPNPSIRKRGKTAPERITANNLPDPECIIGFPESQVRRLLGPAYERFIYWMHGQTMAICNGKAYNYAKKEYEDTSCGPEGHGRIIYFHDLQRWLYTEGRV